MTMADGSISIAYVDMMRTRAVDMADACTRCGKCFDACPMVSPAGLSAADPAATVGGVLDLLRGGEGNTEAVRWASVCTGSGYCIPSCDYGVNPRFMVQLARGYSRRLKGEATVREQARQAFTHMTRGAKILARLTLPPQRLAQMAPARSQPPRKTPPEVIFYTGCNVLKTPHIALLCLDILDMLGVDYEVVGGVAHCCGVYQFREGDLAATGRVAFGTIDGLASKGSACVLSWCPSCQIQFTEVSMPNYAAQNGGQKPFEIEPILVFLAERADQIGALMKHPVEKRVALHERPSVPEVMKAVRRLLSIVPGLEQIDVDVPRVGIMANSLAVLPAFGRELKDQEIQAVIASGATTLATVYHACHREFCDAGDGRGFETLNFLELLGEGLGIWREDLYRRLKAIGDVDGMIADAGPMIEAHGLDLDSVREALMAEFFPAQSVALETAQR